MRKRLASILRIPGDEAAFPILVAMRKTLRQGYDRQSFVADLFAGLVVGVVAIPLSMALAIAVDAPPQHGLYTAFVCGALVALLGGSKHQVTGPTAAFVVILAPIVGRFGLGGLLTAGLLAGLILVAMGVLRFGRLLQFIPHPVTTGFTAGIATVIAGLQLKDFFGLRIADAKAFSRLDFVEKMEALVHARGSAHLGELAVGAGTLAVLLVAPRVTKRVPAPLVALFLASVAAAIVHRALPHVEIATIGDRYAAPELPRPTLPWAGNALSLAYARALLPAAFAIAMLGAIESLLSAVVADGMTGKRHDSNAELVALGIGNIVGPFFGAIAATGALARTATNIRSGARSPVAAIVHALVVLLFMLFLARLVAYVPMSSLAALLMLVAWNMSEARHAVHIVRIAPKSDVAVLLTCYVLTVVFDMVVAVSVGVMLAALLFMRRMSELTQSRTALVSEEMHNARLPDSILLYEIAGAMFFGAAQVAMDQLDRVDAKVKVVIFDLGRVPTIDATGIVALESAVTRLRRAKKRVLIAGPLPKPSGIFDRSSVSRDAEVVFDRPEAIAIAIGAADLPVASARPPHVGPASSR